MIYILASSYQVAADFCRNQNPELNPRGKNIRILLHAESAYGINLHPRRDVVHRVTRPNDNLSEYKRLVDAWKIVEVTSRAEE